MEIKDRFTCHNARGLFPDGFPRQKPARLALPETRPTLFRAQLIAVAKTQCRSSKSGGEFLNKTKHKQISKNQQDRACRIELADLGLKFPLVKSILLPVKGLNWSIV